MGYLDKLVAGPLASTPYPPTHDFWYNPVGGQQSAAGVRVSPDTALNVGAVFACVDLISDVLAAPPLITYERKSGGARERATGHPLYEPLHDTPNDAMTSYQWRKFSEMCRLLRGNAYSRKVPGPRGFVDQIVPLLPQRVTPRRTPTAPGRPPGPVVYDVLDDNGRTHTLQADEVMHIPGPLASDGFTGLSIVSLARETIGLALAVESYSARHFSQNAVPRGVLSVEGKLLAEGRARLRDAWQETYGGLANQGKVAVVDAGATFQAIAMSNEDSQMLDSRRFEINEISRWFRVPPHMIGDTDRTTSWGSGIEHLSLGFILYTMLPRYRDWETIIQRDLIIASGKFFVEFLIDGFLRGDAMTRAQSLQIQRQNGVLTANEWRLMENRTPYEDGDEYWQPANIGIVGAPPPAPPAPPAPAPQRPERGDTSARAQRVAELYAGRIVRKEVKALSRQATRAASDTEGWRVYVTEFYDTFTGELAAELDIPEGQARLYCENHRDRLLEDGAGALLAWEETATPVLAALALEG